MKSPKWLRFYARAVRRTVRDTASQSRPFFLHIFFTTTLPFALWAVLRVLHATQPNWRPDGWEVAVDWQAIIAASGLFLVFLIILISGTVHLILAPIRMEREAKEKADKQFESANDKLAVALEENEKLKKDRIANINTVARTGLRRLGEGPHLMWAELEVYNTSSISILEDVRVRIVDSEHIAQSQEDPKLFKNLGHILDDWSPITLRWSQSEYVTAHIPGGASRTVLVAFSDNTNGPPAVFNDVDRTRCSLELKITVEISSPSSSTLHNSYFVSCHGNELNGPSSHFEFEAWDEWASTRTIVDIEQDVSESVPHTEGSPT